MRISDWSSDVCSSDLAQLEAQAFVLEARIGLDIADDREVERGEHQRVHHRHAQQPPIAHAEAAHHVKFGRGGEPPERSEEHTSELQSLMRISYAVFCLKKKNTTTKITKHHRMCSTT